MWGTSKYLSESLKRIKRGQNVGNTLQDYVNWYLNSECWSLLLLVQIPSSWLGSQPEAMTSAFETWKCEAWCPYLTAAHARNPRIHKIGNAWSWISWGILGGCYLFFLWCLLGARWPKIMLHVAWSDACLLSAAAPRSWRSVRNDVVLIAWLLIQWENWNGPKQMLEPIEFLT